MSQNIRNNFSSLLLAHLWHKGCLFLAAVLLAHRVGSAPLGRFLSAISFVWLFWMLIDGGLSELFIRDVAARRSLLVSYARQLLRLKAVLAGAALLLMAALTSRYAPLRQDAGLILVLGGALVAESYATVFRVIFRIMEEMQREAWLWALDGALKLLVVGLVLWTPGVVDPVMAVALGWLAVSLCGCLLAAWAVRRWRLDSGPPPRAGTGFDLLRHGLSFVLVYGLSLVNLRGVIVLVGILRGHDEAGYFGAAERALEALLIVPIAMAQVLLPVSARLGAGSVETLKRMAWRVVGGLLGAGALTAVGLVLFGPLAVRLVYGAHFQQTAALMGVVGWIMIPLFVKPAVEKVLCGLHRQNTVWRWYLAAALGNLAAVLWLVPTHGLRGAALCVLVAETVSVGGLLWVLQSVLIRTASDTSQRASPGSIVLTPVAQEAGV